MSASEKLSIDQLAAKIANWGYARGITVNGSMSSQTLKLVSEVGELCDGVAKKRPAEVKDGIGDCFVVLVMIAELAKMPIEDCIQAAWDEIKDRKGYLNEQGIFIKEGDTPS